MAKLTDDSIMVVKRQELFDGVKDLFTGLILTSNPINFKERILNNYEFLPRNQVENDPQYVQPSIYSVIINHLKESIFLYRRGRSIEFRGYSENRSLWKLSIGVGGHIIKYDLDNKDIIEQNLINKLEHEVSGLGIHNNSFLGYLYSDEDEISRFHFGLIYVVETNQNIVLPKDEQMTEGSMVSIADAIDILKKDDNDFEAWSKILLIKMPLRKSKITNESCYCS